MNRIYRPWAVTTRAVAEDMNAPQQARADCVKAVKRELRERGITNADIVCRDDSGDYCAQGHVLATWEDN